MIQFQNVSKVFPDGTKALSELTVTIPANQLTVLIGPSGCGKTTLLKMINQLERQTSGEILVHDQPITNTSPVELRRNIGYVIQRIGLFPHMTIEKNVRLVPQLKGWEEARTTERIHTLMQLVGLDPSIYLPKYPLELSGGQQQRVGFVRALAADPEILLMDEPFSALDPISREQLQDEIQQLQTSIQKTIVFVTHDMDEALKIADHIILMKDGKIEQSGTPEQLINEPANDFVRAFIGLERLKKNRNWKDYTLHELPLTLGTVEQSHFPTIQMQQTVGEAIALFEQTHTDTLTVMEQDSVKGTLTQLALLKVAAEPSEVPV